MGAPTVEQDWIQLTEPDGLGPQDLYRFFGIPPETESALKANIKLKRQFWTKRANGPGSRELAAKVKQNIQNLSKVLEEGAVPERIVPTGDGTYRVLGEITTPAELAEQLEIFLRIGDVSNVVATARAGLEKWPDDTGVLTTIALALSEITRDYQDISADVRALARSSTEMALAANPGSPDVWLASARTLMAVGEFDQLRALEARAQAQGIALMPEFLGVMATSAFRAGDLEGGVRRLIGSVEASGGDPGVRSVCTDAIIREVLLTMLPLGSKQEADAFAEAVRIAAWVADGVPESEAELLKFRVWATEARARIFIGDTGLKSFLGVLSGFLMVPLFTKMASRPRWRVLHDGPSDETTWQQWIDVADGMFIEEVHRLAARPFEWQRAAGEPWPSAQQVVDFHVNQSGDG